MPGWGRWKWRPVSTAFSGSARHEKRGDGQRGRWLACGWGGWGGWKAICSDDPIWGMLFCVLVDVCEDTSSPLDADICLFLAVIVWDRYGAYWGRLLFHRLAPFTCCEGSQGDRKQAQGVDQHSWPQMTIGNFFRFVGHISFSVVVPNGHCM